jgi:carbon-monoxide dehydrogenase medium subunit
MIPAAFEYHSPKSLREAVLLLRRHSGEAKLLAGGQSLIPMMKLRVLAPTHVVDLARIEDLTYIREDDDGLAIGPMTTYRMLQTSLVVRERFPLLAEAADLVADVQVRNKGTIGGAIAHADPAGDLPAVVVASEARIRAVGGRKRRSIAAHRFFIDMFETVLAPTELITEVHFPWQPPRTGGSYQKFANKASHFAVVGVSALVTLDGQGNCRRVRVGVTGAGPKATRARASEGYLEGRAPTATNIAGAAQRAVRGIEFLDDLHGSAEYREHLTTVLVDRALAEAVERAARAPA